MSKFPVGFKAKTTNGSQVIQLEEKMWQLRIPAGSKEKYRLAQLDDYDNLPRKFYNHYPPCEFSIRARASAKSIHGTWGFGFWNVPFSFAIPNRAKSLQLPTFPNAAWFICCSPPNYLSFHDDMVGQGWMAATYRSPHISNVRLAAYIPVLPLFIFPWIVKAFRKRLSQIIEQEVVSLNMDPTEWHNYKLLWSIDRTTFFVNGNIVLESKNSPRGPLSFVIWIDNQFASFSPSGRLSFGTLKTSEPAWIQFSEFNLSV